MKLMANAAKGLMLAAFMEVGTTTVNAQENSEETTYKPVTVGNWVKGEEVTGNGQEVYIYNVGSGTFISGTSATVKDIKEANTWTISDGSNGTHTFACNNSTADRIHMNYDYVFPSFKWVADIRKKSGASDINIEKGSTENSYTLSVTKNLGTNMFPNYQTRYFTVNGTGYEAASTATTNSDWLFISTKQKDAYVDYVNSFNEVDSYLTNEKVEKDESLLAKIKEVLTKVSDAGHSFATYDGDKAKLTGILDEIKNFLNTPTGIETIKPATDNAQATAIYDVNGVRKNNLTKGINIVKMSDGTTKKVIK